MTVPTYPSPTFPVCCGAYVQAKTWPWVPFKLQDLFFCSKIWCRVPRCIELLVSSVGDWFSTFSCFSWPWQFGRVLVLVGIYQRPLNLCLSDVFLMSSLCLQVFFFWMWCPCHPSYQGIHNIPLVSWWCYLDHRGKVSARSRCLHCEGTALPSHSLSFGSESLSSAHTQGQRGLSFPSGEGVFTYIICHSSLIKVCPLTLTYSVIYVYLYARMDM